MEHESGPVELDRRDLYWARRRLPAALYGLMKRHPGKLVVAGGFLRACVSGERPSDCDVFMRRPPEVSQADFANLSRDMAMALLPARSKLIETENAFTVKGHGLPIQFVHRWSYTDPAELLKSFDFTMAQAAIWYAPGSDNKVDGPARGWRSMAGARFYPDLAAKRLIYAHPEREEEAGGSLLRVLKFYQRGFRIPLDDFAAVIVRLLRGVRWEGVGGVSPGYDEGLLQKVLCGLLREVDPNIDPDHLGHLPSAQELDQVDEEIQP